MSTRSTTHFIDSEFSTKPIAIVYRHSDGYPSGAGRDIILFLRLCKALPDSRLNDPSYLAAKYVVFLADMFNSLLKRNDVTGEYERVPNKSRLDFLSIGIVESDPGDIEYRYVIDCGKLIAGKPTVTCFEVGETEKIVSIPRGKNNWL
jgi:hypothetical protein